MITLTELLEKLSTWDQMEIIELFNVTSEELVEALKDIIEDRYDNIINEVDDQEDDD